LASAVEGRLFELPPMKHARTVLLFSSFGSEVSTEAIRRRLAGEGRRVLLPFLRRGEMGAAEHRPRDELVATPYGPKEPPNPIPLDPREVDVAIAPGLAFDRCGYRVGYGGGHYDRYLARLGPHATTVGIGFHLQLVDEVPHGPDDVPLHFVVTDRETLACRAAEHADEDGTTPWGPPGQ
jgi:5-formyltetrahydrofolate cyclo-ligase